MELKSGASLRGIGKKMPDLVIEVKEKVHRGFAAYFAFKKNGWGSVFPTLKRGANFHCAYGAGARLRTG